MSARIYLAQLVVLIRGLLALRVKLLAALEVEMTLLVQEADADATGLSVPAFDGQGGVVSSKAEENPNETMTATTRTIFFEGAMSFYVGTTPDIKYPGIMTWEVH